jgi:hypothetical protein
MNERDTRYDFVVGFLLGELLALPFLLALLSGFRFNF